jgi:hypothetical protein
MLDLVYRPPVSTTDTEFQQKPVNFKGNSPIIKKRANEDYEDYAATKRDANKPQRSNEDYAATELDASKVRDQKLRVNEDNMATERGAIEACAQKNCTLTRTMRPPNAKLIKRAFKICAPTRTMRPPSAMIAMLKSAHKKNDHIEVRSRACPGKDE